MEPKMDPAKILEDMVQIESRLRWGKFNQYDHLDKIAAFLGDKTPSPEQRNQARLTWNTIKGQLAIAVPFTFSNVQAENAHLEFGGTLLENKMLVLPFESVLISADKFPKTALMAGIARERLVVVAFGRFGYPGAPENVTCPFCVSASDVAFGVDNPLIHVSPILAGADDNVYDNGLWAFQEALAFLTLLLSKEIDHRIEPAPVKLNAKRARMGRPPIPERHTITIRKDILRTFSGNSSSTQGSPASPIMHWRRGHLRHLSNGSVLKIAPTVVNAQDAVKPVIKQYIIRKGGTHEPKKE
jgi:hypothetical protein